MREKFLVNLFILIKERFNIAVYLPTIAMLVLANALYLSTSRELAIDSTRLLTVFVLFLLFFMRMRFFDEIKDYEVDVRVNPTRPLARGVLSCDQLKKYILGVVLLELILLSTLGFNAFFLYSFAIFYSFLMYEEFFIGDILRPHLTTYAISHTFVIFLMCFAGTYALFDINVAQYSVQDIYFFLANWAIFNLFEFARKSFATTEERPTVDSYSSLFTHRGAWLLSVVQVMAGAGLVNYVLDLKYLWILTLFYGLLTLPYLLNAKISSAKIFRAVSSAYLLAFYLNLVLELGVKNVGH